MDCLFRILGIVIFYLLHAVFVNILSRDASTYSSVNLHIWLRVSCFQILSLARACTCVFSTFSHSHFHSLSTARPSTLYPCPHIHTSQDSAHASLVDFHLTSRVHVESTRALSVLIAPPFFSSLGASSNHQHILIANLVMFTFSPRRHAKYRVEYQRDVNYFMLKKLREHRVSQSLASDCVPLFSVSALCHIGSPHPLPLHPLSSYQTAFSSCCAPKAVRSTMCWTTFTNRARNSRMRVRRCTRP